MADTHSHHHGAGAHLHGASPGAGAKRLAIALALIVGLMAAEVVAGVLAHSLALLSDAGHMLTDAAALGLSIVALRLAARPARGALMTFGLGRAEILSAQANGVTLLVLAGLIVYSAVGTARVAAARARPGRWWGGPGRHRVNAAATATLARRATAGA